MQHPITIVGGGGHALVIAEAIQLLGLPINGYIDDDPRAPLAKTGMPRTGGVETLGHISKPWICAIGDIRARRQIINRIPSRAQPITIVHPSAWVSPTAQVAPGTYVGPGAIIHTLAQVGSHAIINSRAVVEHECIVGSNAHVACGAVLAGRVSVGSDVLVGINASLLPGVHIGDCATVGAGAVVRDEVLSGVTAVGVPAKSVQTV